MRIILGIFQFIVCGFGYFFQNKWSRNPPPQKKIITTITAQIGLGPILHACIIKHSFIGDCIVPQK